MWMDQRNCSEKTNVAKLYQKRRTSMWHIDNKETNSKTLRFKGIIIATSSTLISNWNRPLKCLLVLSFFAERNFCRLFCCQEQPILIGHISFKMYLLTHVVTYRCLSFITFLISQHYCYRHWAIYGLTFCRHFLSFIGNHFGVDVLHSVERCFIFEIFVVKLRQGMRVCFLLLSFNIIILT